MTYRRTYSERRFASAVQCSIAERLLREVDDQAVIAIYIVIHHQEMSHTWVIVVEAYTDMDSPRKPKVPKRMAHTK